MRLMPLVGVAVADLATAVPRFEALFGVRFRVFTAGVDYPLTVTATEDADTAPPLPAHVRIAVDEDDTFELLEIPGDEGVRNIHARVDDIDAEVARLRTLGLRPAQDLRAGSAREVIYDAAALHGVRLCLLQFEGASFAAALAAAPDVTAAR